jgi:hypothetical protein
MRAVAALQREVEIAAIGADALDWCDDPRIFRQAVGHGGQFARIDEGLECRYFRLSDTGGK